MKSINFLLAIIVLFAGIAGIAYVVKNDMVKQFLEDETATDNDDEEADSGRDRIRIIDGYKAIVLDEEMLRSAGLATEQLASRSFRPEFTTYAEVIDIDPVVTLKTEYVNLLAEKRVLQNAVKNQREILERAEALHKARSLSTSELDLQRANYEQKTAELHAMSTRIENLGYKVRSEWGDVIGDLILKSDREQEFNRLAMHRTSLVMLSLPKNRTFNPDSQDVYVSYNSKRDNAVRAVYLDDARLASNPLYGESYIYLVESEKLRPGMHLFAWIEETEEAVSGLFVPGSAVIWYANEPWIYIQHDGNVFVRIPLTNGRKMENGWLLTNGIEKNERVVTRGGQTLLSEEFKWAIPDEDND